MPALTQVSVAPPCTLLPPRSGDACARIRTPAARRRAGDRTRRRLAPTACRSRSSARGWPHPHSPSAVISRTSERVDAVVLYIRTPRIPELSRWYVFNHPVLQSLSPMMSPRVTTRKPTSVAGGTGVAPAPAFRISTAHWSCSHGFVASAAAASAAVAVRPSPSSWTSTRKKFVTEEWPFVSVSHEQFTAGWCSEG